MFVGAARAEFHLPRSSSLKAKRSVVQSLKHRIANRYSVSVAEVDHQELWQRAALGVAVVSGEKHMVDEVLAGVRRLCESEERAVLVDFLVDVR
jgi:uncharacterized protein YlxP (DUF503 family)